MEKLWTREPKTGLFVDLFRNVTAKWPAKVGRVAGKRNNHADEHRAGGNKLFAKKEWSEAMEEYNRSICCAEFGSESMGLAYANRSTCFLHLGKYDNCLRDIELAIQMNYPERLLPKLEQRKTDCLKMKADDNEIPLKPIELSYASSVNFPGMANVLAIQRNAEFGRHIVAKCGIPTGKTILVEPNFSSSTVLVTYSSCAGCQFGTGNLLPCKNCTLAMFCSDECMERGHGNECGYMISTTEQDQWSRHVLRLISLSLDTCGGVGELMAFVEDVRREGIAIPTAANSPMDQLRMFLQLNQAIDGAGTRVVITQLFKQGDLTYRVAMGIPKTASLFDTSAKKRFLMHLITMYGNILMKTSYTDARRRSERLISVNSIGLVFGMFNHLCVPNVMCETVGGKRICITTRPIKKGDQLYVNYVSGADVMGVEISRETIYLLNGFWCKCEKCVPVPFSMYQKRLFESEWSYQAIHTMMAAKNVDWKLVHELCIEFLNKYGVFSYNEILEFIFTVFKKSISKIYICNSN